MNELLDDMARLIGQGVSRIETWWEDFRDLDLRSSKGQASFARTLDRYHQKRQLAYAEIAERSFPGLRPHLRTLRMMPFRFEIEAEFHSRRGFEDVSLNHRRWPVASYDKAGADVSFPATKSDYYNHATVQATVERTDALLSQFGRYFPDRVVSWGGTRVPNLFGHNTSFDGVPDESAVVRGAMALLAEDLKYLFAEIPTYGTAGRGSR